MVNQRCEAEVDDERSLRGSGDRDSIAVNQALAAC